MVDWRRTVTARRPLYVRIRVLLSREIPQQPRRVMLMTRQPERRMTTPETWKMLVVRRERNWPLSTRLQSPTQSPARPKMRRRML